MDNERPIEKLLRDYAAQRRAQAGEPRELHPATRRLLQGEVARQYPRTGREGSVVARFFARWRPGFVYALCALALVAISLPLLLQSTKKNESTAHLAKAVPAERAAEEAPRIAEPPAPAALSRELDAAAPAAGRNRTEESFQTALSPTEANREQADASDVRFQDRMQVTPGSRAPATESPTRSVTATPPPAVRRQAAEPPAPAPAATDPATLSLAARSAAPAPAPASVPEATAFQARYGAAPAATSVVAQKFTQAIPASSPRPATVAEKDAPSVLATFHLEQTGQQLRVIDSDGSAYLGSIAQERNNYFQVTGTNRTLQQAVVFSGNLVVLTNVVAGGQATPTLSPSAQNQIQLSPSQSQLPLLQNSIISGRVQWGTNREMQINAVPVPP